MTTDITYISGRFFKVTIPAEGMRLKIPETASKEDQAHWITRCEGIYKHFMNNPHPVTLRGRTLGPTNLLYLKIAKRNKSAFYVRDLEVIKKEVNLIQATKDTHEPIP